MRRAVAVLFSGLFFVVGCTAAPGERRPVPSPGLASAVAASPTADLAGGCGTTPVRMGGVPGWASAAHPPPDLPSVLSHEGNLVGVVFGYPLMSPASGFGRQNKILWIAREPRDGSELKLTLRPQSGGDAVDISEPAGASPGEIYPSIVDVPAAGCWSVVAEWNGHRATLELSYQPSGK